MTKDETMGVSDNSDELEPHEVAFANLSPVPISELVRGIGPAYWHALGFEQGREYERSRAARDESEAHDLEPAHCTHCRGTGYVSNHRDSLPCARCAGTGAEPPPGTMRPVAPAAGGERAIVVGSTWDDGRVSVVDYYDVIKENANIREQRDVALATVTELTAELEDARRDTTQLWCDITNAWSSYQCGELDREEFEGSIAELAERNPHGRCSPACQGSEHTEAEAIAAIERELLAIRAAIPEAKP